MGEVNYWVGKTGDYRFKFRSQPPKEWIEGATIFKNGIDRIDNTLGYFKTNCATACTDCNRAKMEMSQSDFLTLVKLIYNNRKLA